MEPFHTHRGKIAVLNQDNIDTDRIMPARFLSRIERAGYGELLFNDVRGPEFVLNQPDANGASILVTGCNFGCGSSREHAVWGLQQAGFKVIIARKDSEHPGYSDIFRQNSANCGLLLIELPDSDHSKLASQATGTEIIVHLVDQSIIINDEIVLFEMNPAVKDALVKGKDLIGTTLELESIISEFERSSTGFVPEFSSN